MTTSERISQIAELVCETAAELKKSETDILKRVHDEINRREREVLIGLGEWTADDEKDWLKSTKDKSFLKNDIELNSG
jgi:Trm5-related predicted tRNA methylase